MREQDRQRYIERYEGRLQQHGPTPEALGWGTNGRQAERFVVLAASALARPESSVLDVGCGFADLYTFLRAHGWCGHYTGVDLVPGLLDVARERHSDLDVRQLDISESGHSELGTYDLVLASGIFNAALEAGNNLDHIESALMNMLAHAETSGGVVAADFMSTWVDFEKPGAWHTSPSQALAIGRVLTRRLALRLDYMPYEFALFLHRDDQISSRNVFSGHNAQGPA